MAAASSGSTSISNITGSRVDPAASGHLLGGRWRWRESSDQIDCIAANRWRDFKTAQADGKGDVIIRSGGLRLSLAEDCDPELSVAYSAAYAPLMSGEADQRTAFEVATSRPRTNSPNFAQIARWSATFDNLDGFSARD